MCVSLLLSFVALAQERVVIGAMDNLTGGQGDVAIASAEGARLAVAQAHTGSGVLARAVRLHLVDGKTQPKVIAAEPTALFNAAPDIAGVFGYSDPDMVLVAAPLAAAHRRVFLIAGTTSPELPAQIPDFLFLGCFGGKTRAAAGTEQAYAQLKARTVAVLYNETSSSACRLHSYFQTRFEELGGEVRAAAPRRYDDQSFGDIARS